jgi:hypothetical protein
MILGKKFNKLVNYLSLDSNTQIISYLTLRKLIGILGILLSIICILGGYLFSGNVIQPSISSYYHTNMRDFFVGILACVSLFLITYRGYQVIDNLVSTICGISAAGIALFPCLNELSPELPIGLFQLDPKTSNIIHLSCAGLFFFLLAINSMFLFTLNKSKKKSQNKIKRNRIFYGCGITILLSLLCLAVLFIFNPGNYNKYKPILIIESIMLFAFGISWLVKGGTLYRDVRIDAYIP